MGLNDYIGKYDFGSSPIEQPPVEQEQAPYVQNIDNVTQPQGMANPEHAAIFMKYAQKAAMAGLNTDADNFLSIAKSLGGGGSTGNENQIVEIADPKDPTKQIRMLVSKKDASHIGKVGDIPTDPYKIGSRKEVVLKDGSVVDSIIDPNSKQVHYYDYKTQSFKPINQPYTPANMLLSASENAQYGTPAGTTKGDVAKLGLSSISAQKRGELSSFDQSMNIVADMEKYSKKVNTFNAGPAGMERIYNAAKNTIGSNLQTNPDAAMLDTKAGELSNIIRAMGEKGALAEGDVARGLLLIPTKGDTKSIAEQKIKDLRDLFGKNKASLSGSLTNQITSKKKPDPFGIR